MARRRRGGPGWVRPALVIVVPVVLATTVAVLVLMRLLDVASSQGRLEMIRTALAVGAGTGAVMTLVLAWRRQWSTERRLTELYVKAVEQLGSDKAAVRHGALYALERVAQDNPDHRQTVVDVICAYLRAPYIPALDKSGARKLGGLRAPLRSNRPAWQRSLSAAAPPLPTSDEDNRQEREVRLTAQRILERHLQPGRRVRLRRPAHTFWPQITLDLTDATLINFSLQQCALGDAGFSGARFIGAARFDGTRFTGAAGFDGAHFSEDARFGGARFSGGAGFNEARFGEDARFGGARFTGTAGFDGARFIGDAWFDGARFNGPARFGGARFSGSAGFGWAHFHGLAGFSEVCFGLDAGFDWTRFDGSARFGNARFDGSAGFDGTRFNGPARFDEAILPSTLYVNRATPSPWTSFSGARFKQGMPAEVAPFVQRNDRLELVEPRTRQ